MIGIIYIKRVFILSLLISSVSILAQTTNNNELASFFKEESLRPSIKATSAGGFVTSYSASTIGYVDLGFFTGRSCTTAVEFQSMTGSYSWTPDVNFYMNGSSVYSKGASGYLPMTDIKSVAVKFKTSSGSTPQSDTWSGISSYTTVYACFDIDCGGLGSSTSTTCVNTSASVPIGTFTWN